MNGGKHTVNGGRNIINESRISVNGGGNIVNEWEDAVNRRDGISGNSIRKLK